jgi:hypothetical protein
LDRRSVTPPHSAAGETRIVFRGADYAVYEALVEAIPDSASVRMAFDGEDLEIMMRGGPRERFKKLLATIVSVISEELEIPRADQGSRTWKGLELGRGLESDECYYFDLAKQSYSEPSLIGVRYDVARCPCKPHYLGTLAAADAEAGHFDKAVEWQEKANKLFGQTDQSKEARQGSSCVSRKRPTGRSLSEQPAPIRALPPQPKASAPGQASARAAREPRSSPRDAP